MVYYVYSKLTGEELAQCDTLESACCFANKHGDCEVQDDGSDEVIYET